MTDLPKALFTILGTILVVCAIVAVINFVRFGHI